MEIVRGGGIDPTPPALRPSSVDEAQIVCTNEFLGIENDVPEYRPPSNGGTVDGLVAQIAKKARRRGLRGRYEVGLRNLICRYTFVIGFQMYEPIEEDLRERYAKYATGR